MASGRLKDRRERPGETVPRTETACSRKVAGSERPVLGGPWAEGCEQRRVLSPANLERSGQEEEPSSGGAQLQMPSGSSVLGAMDAPWAPLPGLRSAPAERDQAPDRPRGEAAEQEPAARRSGREPGPEPQAPSRGTQAHSGASCKAKHRPREVPEDLRKKGVMRGSV